MFIGVIAARDGFKPVDTMLLKIILRVYPPNTVIRIGFFDVKPVHFTRTQLGLNV